LQTSGLAAVATGQPSHASTGIIFGRFVTTISSAVRQRLTWNNFEQSRGGEDTIPCGLNRVEMAFLSWQGRLMQACGSKLCTASKSGSAKWHAYPS